MTAARLKRLASALLAALSANGYAQQAGEESATRLPAVTVRSAPSAGEIPLDMTVSTGSRLGTTLRETPASVDVITREVMRERGNRTTQQALENAVGVATGQCFGLTCVSMRGFSGTTSLPFLFNGVRYPGLAFSPRGTFVYDRIESASRRVCRAISARPRWRCSTSSARMY